ncbi:acyltransferase [Streptomyces sp. NPDC048057]|uniref:acyltransferase family protein n=1 Tax=Streptomyces sp. NPDC048057 TaxID=3155628 RepID=UPI0033F54D78
MRFVAALLVFAFHVTFPQTGFYGGEAGDLLGTLAAKAGFYGVCFFFILSGFVLTWSARADDTAPRVWRRRLVKIFPNHIVTLVLAALLMLAVSQPIPVWRALTNLFLVQTWAPDMATVNSMNTVSWSLACEMFFYLCFPLLLRMLNALPAHRLWPAAGVVAVLALTLPFVGQFLISDQPNLPFIGDGSLSFQQVWSVYFFPPARALEFVLGMVIARIVQTGRWPQLGLAPSVLIAAAGYAVASNVPYLFSIAGAAALWLVPLVASGAVADLRGHRSFFRDRTLVRLGELSFAFYMVHALVVEYGHRLIGRSEVWSLLPGTGLSLAALALSLVLAHVLFTWVETPLARRFSTPRRRSAGPPPAAPPARPVTAGPGPLEPNE